MTEQEQIAQLTLAYQKAVANGLELKRQRDEWRTDAERLDYFEELVDNLCKFTGSAPTNLYRWCEDKSAECLLRDKDLTQLKEAYEKAVAAGLKLKEQRDDWKEMAERLARTITNEHSRTGTDINSGNVIVEDGYYREVDKALTAYNNMKEKVRAEAMKQIGFLKE